MKPRLACSTKTCWPVNGPNPPGGGGTKSRILPVKAAAAFVVRYHRTHPGRRPRRMISTITRYPTVATRAATVWRGGRGRGRARPPPRGSQPPPPPPPRGQRKHTQPRRWGGGRRGG